MASRALVMPLPGDGDGVEGVDGEAGVDVDVGTVRVRRSGDVGGGCELQHGVSCSGIGAYTDLFTYTDMPICTRIPRMHFPASIIRAYTNPRQQQAPLPLLPPPSNTPHLHNIPAAPSMRPQNPKSQLIPWRSPVHAHICFLPSRPRSRSCSRSSTPTHVPLPPDQGSPPPPSQLSLGQRLAPLTSTSAPRPPSLVCECLLEMEVLVLVLVLVDTAWILLGLGLGTRLGAYTWTG